jgi:hypothetical protein
MFVFLINRVNVVYHKFKAVLKQFFNFIIKYEINLNVASSDNDEEERFLNLNKLQDEIKTEVKVEDKNETVRNIL